MASSQIEIFDGIIVDSSRKMSKIITEMLTPLQLAPDYPLSFTEENPVKWDQIPEEEKYNGKSFNNMIYRYLTERETTRSWTFVKKMTSLTNLMSDSFLT